MKRPLATRILPNRFKESLYYRYYHTRHADWRGLFESAPLAFAPHITMHGLLPGDVIYAVGRVPVKDLEGLRSSVSALDADKPAILQLERQGKVRYLAVWLEDSQRR